ncbi:hypothetical protein KBC54_01275 [Patescibacteria group bacterium]|nr:hypothetical protein [Patescibacteria group bacterium]
MMIITRPEHDPTTRYISAWSEAVIEAAKSANYQCVDLYREKANRKDFEGRVEKLDPELVVLQGHGNEECVTGHDDEPLVTLGDNDELLAGRVTYAVSCDAAKELGQKVAQNAGSTFIGYDDKFVFVQQHEKWHRPLEDDRAKPFMEMSNQVPLGLLKGRSAGEAYQRSQEVGKTHLRRLMASSSNPDALFDARHLWWNLKHQVCLGDESRKIRKT